MIILNNSEIIKIDENSKEIKDLYNFIIENTDNILNDDNFSIRIYLDSYENLNENYNINNNENDNSDDNNSNNNNKKINKDIHIKINGINISLNDFSLLNFKNINAICVERFNNNNNNRIKIYESRNLYSIILDKIKETKGYINSNDIEFYCNLGILEEYCKNINKDSRSNNSYDNKIFINNIKIYLNEFNINYLKGIKGLWTLEKENNNGISHLNNLNNFYSGIYESNDLFEDLNDLIKINTDKNSYKIKLYINYSECINFKKNKIVNAYENYDCINNTNNFDNCKDGSDNFYISQENKILINDIPLKELNNSNSFNINNLNNITGLWVDENDKIHETNNLLNIIKFLINQNEKLIRIYTNFENKFGYKIDSCQILVNNILLNKLDNFNINDLYKTSGLWIDENDEIHKSNNLLDTVKFLVNRNNGLIKIYTSFSNKLEYKLNKYNNSILINGKTLNELSNFNISDLENVKGLWIDESNIVHESNDLFRTLKELVNNNVKNIKLHTNETNKLDFALKNVYGDVKISGIGLDKFDFESICNVPGVWFLYGTDTRDNKVYCLTGGESQDIGNEINWTKRVLVNPNLQEIEKNDPGSTGRWDKIQKYYKGYEYVLVNIGEKDREKRQVIEAAYAILNNALYWKPSITQLSNDFQLKLKKFINKRKEKGEKYT